MQLSFLAVRTHSPDETAALGAKLAEVVRGGDVLLLVGDLGSGKTTFVQGLARGLGLQRRPRSPTFTLVNIHDGGRLRFVHADLYRTDTAPDVLSLGLEDVLDDGSVAAIEWGEKAEPVVGEDQLRLEFSYRPDEEDARDIAFTAFGSWRDRTREISDSVRTWAAR